MSLDRTQRPETAEERIRVLRDVVAECSAGIVKDCDTWLTSEEPAEKKRALQRMFVSSNTLRTASYNLLRNVEAELRGPSK